MELWEQGLELRRKGLKLAEIADKLGAPLNTVKSWSKRHWNNKKVATKGKKSCNLSNKKSATKRGAPKGNKNAVGNKGNRSAVGVPPKHGGYSSIYWNTLDEEERQLIEGTPSDEEALLLNQIKLLDVREYRLLKAIAKYNSINGGLAVNGVLTSNQKREFDTPEERELYESKRQEHIQNGDVDKLGYVKFTQTTTESTLNIVQRLENELTRVQSLKMRCITALKKIRTEQREENEQLARANNPGLLGDFLRVIEEAEK